MAQRPRMKRLTFSSQIALVYTLIIAVPIMLFVFLASEYFRISMYDSVLSDARKAASDDAYVINLAVEQIERLESIITSDYDLLRTFYFTEKKDEDSIIETLRYDIKNIERLQFAMPAIYSIRIFVDNPFVPERWPIVFKEDRLDLPSLPRWSYNYRDNLMGSISAKSEDAVYLTQEILLNKRHVGYLQLGIRMIDFAPFAFRESDGYNYDLLLKGDAPLVPSVLDAGPLLARISNEDPDSANGSFVIRSRSKNLIVAYERIPRLGLIVARGIFPDVINQSVSFIRLGAFFILLLSVALMFLIIKFTTRRLFARLYQVMGAMSELRSGNLDVTLSVSGDDEVTEMAEAFTAMAERIRQLIGETKAEQELVTQTEIKAMQNQINAHFLYNVLETIKMQAELADQGQIVESVTLLGRMMRFCLRWRNHQVMVREELEYVRGYIDLMNIRNDYRIELSIDVDGSYEEFRIPKMIIQPVVENAVLHAIEPEGEDSTIEVTVRPDPERGVLLVRVRDSGIGMDSDEVDRLGHSLAVRDESTCPVGGIGLRNIQERLHAFYGTQFNLQITSAPGAGTEVTIPIPLEDER